MKNNIRNTKQTGSSPSKEYNVWNSKHTDCIPQNEYTRNTFANKLFCSFCELFKKRSAHAVLFIIIPETAVPFEKCKLKIAQPCKFLHLPYLNAIYIDYNESLYTCICIFLEISKASLVLFTLITMSMCIPATVYSSISPTLVLHTLIIMSLYIPVTDWTINPDISIHLSIHRPIITQGSNFKRKLTFKY